MIVVIVPIVVTLVEITTVVNDTECSKAHALIVVTLVGIVILVIGHRAYWYSVIVVVPAGMVTDVNTVSVYRFISATA
jgi:hypothetical protein